MASDLGSGRGPSSKSPNDRLASRGIRQHLKCAFCDRSPTIGTCHLCERMGCRGCIEDLTGECWCCLGYGSPQEWRPAGSAAAVQLCGRVEKVVRLATLLQCVRGSTAERHEVATLGEGMVCTKIGEQDSSRYNFVIFVSVIAIAAFIVGCFAGAGCSNRKEKEEPPVQEPVPARPRMPRQASREVETMSPVTYTFRRQCPRFLPLGEQSHGAWPMQLLRGRPQQCLACIRVAPTMRSAS